LRIFKKRPAAGNRCEKEKRSPGLLNFRGIKRVSYPS